MNKPYRITIDTNPDQCNLNCIMCDTHSIYNKNYKPIRKFMEKDLLEPSLRTYFFNFFNLRKLCDTITKSL